MTNFKFGKLPQRVDRRTIQLKTVFMLQNLPPLPLTYDVDSEFTAFNDNHMYGNDVYGDCVMAGRAHMTLRFEDFEQSQVIPITDKDVENEYFAETGGSDDGLVMLDSLNLWRKSGWTAAGKVYNIYAYAQLDITNHNELMYSVYLLRGAYVGFNVPQSAMDQFNAGQPWTVVADDGGIVGGHCVYIVGYNQTGPVCVTWGQKQQMNWAFWDKYFDEAYVVIDNIDSWMNPATDPVNISQLQQELNDITTNPVPPPTPTPPPPTVTYTLKVVSSQGNPTPSVGSHTYNEQSQVVCSVVSPVVVSGVSYTCTGFTGTGSVPTKGTALTVTFAIIANSTITWNWVATPIPPTTYNLTVVSAYGSPNPTVGVHAYAKGSPVSCHVPSPVVINSVSFTCTGWTGTGSVPPNGSAIIVSFTITGDSTITWNWTATPPTPPNPPPNIWQEILDLLNKIWTFLSTHPSLDEEHKAENGEEKCSEN